MSLKHVYDDYYFIMIKNKYYVIYLQFQEATFFLLTQLSSYRRGSFGVKNGGCCRTFGVRENIEVLFFFFFKR